MQNDIRPRLFTPDDSYHMIAVNDHGSSDIYNTIVKQAGPSSPSHHHLTPHCNHQSQSPRVSRVAIYLNELQSVTGLTKDITGREPHRAESCMDQGPLVYPPFPSSGSLPLSESALKVLQLHLVVQFGPAMRSHKVLIDRGEKFT